MKILHIQGEYLTFGGAETYLRDLMGAQMAEGHSVSVIYGADTPPDYTPAAGEHFLGPSYGLRSGISVWNRFRHTVKQIDPQIIHLHVTHYHLSPLIIQYLASIRPTVQTVHDTLAFCFKEPNAPALAEWARMLPDGTACYHGAGLKCFGTGCSRTFVRKAGVARGAARIASVLWRRAAHRRVRRFLANSEFIREDLVRNGFPSRRVRTLILTPSIPGSWKLDDETTSDGEAPMILYAGKISTLKGVPQLVEALALLRDKHWRAVIAGNGVELPAVQATVRARGLEDRVEFVGAVSREQLGDLYRSARIVAFPSIWPEPFGLVGPEAMLFGKPVVGFDVGGVKEWLADGETGFLVPAGDVSGLAERMSRLLRDDRLCRQLGANARKASKRLFGMEAHAAKVLDAYAEACS